MNLVHTECPTQEDLPAIEDSYWHYFAALVECYCIVSDLSRELQNVFLGDLFDNRVPPREPTVSNCVVVTTRPEDSQRLTEYFTQKDREGLTQYQKDFALRVKLMKDRRDLETQELGI